MAEENVPVGTGREKTPAESLVDAMYAKLGDNWRRDLTVTMRADDWSWLVRLVESAVDDRFKQYKTSGKSDMSELMSISSFRQNLGELVSKLIQALDKPEPKRRKK